MISSHHLYFNLQMHKTFKWSYQKFNFLTHSWFHNFWSTLAGFLADNIRDKLVNTVALLAAKTARYFPEQVVETKTELKAKWILNLQLLGGQKL